MTSAVPFVDLGRSHDQLNPELERAFSRVLGSGRFILGPELEAFEREFAEFVGTRFCVGVGSGTAAITIAVRAAGIGPGDEVIVPAHTYIASALGVVHAGATPVFCDVDDESGLIDLDHAGAVVTERTAAILAVHLYGRAIPPVDLESFARRHGVAVLEDAAQAHGARYDGVAAGAIGLASAFSFYPSKNLGALGDGGAICTDDPAVAELARQIRDLGQRSKGEHVVLGLNERLDELQAALLRVKLPHLTGWNESRRDGAARYRQLLPAGVRAPVPAPDGTHIYHLYPVRVAERDRVRAELGNRGIATGVHYFPAVHRQAPFADDGRPPLPRAESWAAEVLCLPMFPGLTDAEIELVCGELARACGDRPLPSAVP